MRAVIVIGLFLLNAPAHAQLHICFAGDPSCFLPRTYSGDGDLSQAMNICEKHSHDSGTVYPEGGSPPRIYEREWDVCNAIREKWNEGEQAKAERERIEQEKQDKAFVEDFAKRSMKKSGQAPLQIDTKNYLHKNKN